MDFKQLALRIGYPSIFSSSPEDAAANLFRLITNRQGGYDEGAHQWHGEVSRILDGTDDLLELNACGAKFTEDQWRQALRILRDDLGSFLDRDAT